jgi:hypothetical protein
VKKLTALALLSLSFAACGSPKPNTAPQPSGSAANGSGAADARSAVLAFLGAGKNQDLQALSGIWGSSEGAVINTSMSDKDQRDEMEKRELIMMCYLEHDTHQLLSDAPAPNNERVVVAQLRRGPLTRTANFYAVAGPAGRWYVRTFDMEVLTPFCRKGR